MSGRSRAAEDAAAQSRTNIALFIGDVQNFYRTYTTDVRILPGLTGGDMNAGVLVNYYASGGTQRYHVALLNLVSSTFGVYYYNGATLVSVGTPVTVAALQPGDWYRIRLTAKPPMTMATVMNLQAHLQGITNPAISLDISTSVGMNLWNLDGAGAGLYTRRSRARFSYWHVDFAA